jgi:hypothetical protein
MDNCADGLDRLSLVYPKFSIYGNVFKALGEDIFPLVRDKIVEYSKSEDWKFRWAALKALMQTAEGCSPILRKNVRDLPR